MPPALSGLAAQVALAAAAAGSTVEVVGSIGDDGDGDAVVVALGHAGIGHAALLREPGSATPVEGADAEAAPRLDARDIDLGLRYLVDYRVLVIAEPLPPEAEIVALEAAAYHEAEVVAIVPEGAAVSPALAAVGTVFEAPADAGAPFAELVGRYAAALDGGDDREVALRAAASSTGSEPPHA